MKMTPEIERIIASSAYYQSEKGSLRELVSEILKHIPEPAPPPWQEGVVTYRDIGGAEPEYAFLAKGGEVIWIGGTAPARSICDWVELQRQGCHKPAYPNLSEYLKDHPKSVEFLRELFRLERGAQ